MNKVDFKIAVIKAVASRLGQESWFRGVCTDGIQPFVDVGDFEGAVENATTETIFWDCPGFQYGGTK